eukprot:6435514-Alexandrium_andersonii.AAC.1
MTSEARLDAADSPQPGPAAVPRERALLSSPTRDLQIDSEEQDRNVAGYLAEVARAVNTLNERQSAFAGRLVGVEASLRTLVEGVNSAVAGLISQAPAEFQAQGGSVGETRVAMDALYASCCSEFQ